MSYLSTFWNKILKRKIQYAASRKNALINVYIHQGVFVKGKSVYSITIFCVCFIFGLVNSKI